MGITSSDKACLTVFFLSGIFVMIFNNHYIENFIYKKSNSNEIYRFLRYSDLNSTPSYNVSYDQRGFIIGGYRTLLIGGSIHYTRSTPSQWNDLFIKAKEDGLNVIQLYIFWNFHEKEKGVFYFSDRGNITFFLDMAKRHGFFLTVRFGPYVCAEWNNGGLPLWLNNIPGMKIRSSNHQWKREMERYMQHMISISRPYFASEGGPIILAQIENEYNGGDVDYINWCGELVSRINLTIPWMMCEGMAANNTIKTCNGDNCESFARMLDRQSPGKPLIWSENEGWFDSWEDVTKASLIRSPAQMAYSVCQWFALGGAYLNYYMYHGGNNFGRFASAGVTTRYANMVNLHSDGTSNEPKRCFLRSLHKLFIKYQSCILSTRRQLNSPRSVYVYSPSEDKWLLESNMQRLFSYRNITAAIHFIENKDERSCLISFFGRNYTVPSKSIIVFDLHNQLLFNTSSVTCSKLDQYPQGSLYIPIFTAHSLRWNYWEEDINENYRKAMKSTTPLEQLSVTSDRTDYLMYSTSLLINSTLNSDLFLRLTTCDSSGFLVFLNHTFVAEFSNIVRGNDCNKVLKVKLEKKLWTGYYNLRIVSISLGIHSLNTSKNKKGITGRIEIEHGNTSRDIWQNGWDMFPFLRGETLEIYKKKWKHSVLWKESSTYETTGILRWFQTEFPLFDISSNMGVVYIDCKGLQRGRLYLNGRDLGRYWMLHYRASKKFIQRYYQVPVVWLEENNLLSILEDSGKQVSLSSVRIVTRFSSRAEMSMTLNSQAVE